MALWFHPGRMLPTATNQQDQKVGAARNTVSAQRTPNPPRWTANIYGQSTVDEAFQQIFFITSGWWFGTLFIFPCIGNFIIPTD